MSRVRIAAAAAVLAVTGGTIAVVGTSSAGTVAAPKADVRPISDPVAAALGVDTPQEQQALLARQVATSKPAAGAEGDRVRAAKRGLGEAVDQLYAEIAADPAAESDRKAWGACMSDAGTPFASPQAVEAAIQAALDRGKDLPEARANRDRCTDASAGALAVHVGRHFDAWAERNASVIEAYRKALGL